MVNEFERNLRRLLGDLSLDQMEPRPQNSDAEGSDFMLTVPANSEAEGSDVILTEAEDSELQDLVSESENAPEDSDLQDSASANSPQDLESQVLGLEEDSTSDAEMADIKKPKSEKSESMLESSAPGSSDESDRDISLLDFFSLEEEKNSTPDAEKKLESEINSQAKSSQVSTSCKEKENSYPNVYSNAWPAIFSPKENSRRAQTSSSNSQLKRREGYSTARTMFLEHKQEVMGERQGFTPLPASKRPCSK